VRQVGHLPELINPLNAELHPICHLLALLGAHHILHVSRIRVNLCCKVVYAGILNTYVNISQILFHVIPLRVILIG
jgi:hypothetical protein